MGEPAAPTGLTRRQFVLAAGATAFCVTRPARAQNIIEESPMAGAGWAPPGFNQPAVAAPQTLDGSPVAALDWRQHLLAGERSILVRRDGPKQRVRYIHQDGTLDRAGYGQACYLLRDVTAGMVMAMDVKLLDVLCGIQRWMEFNGRTSTISLLSGFRTAATNKSTEGSARNSMHLYGKAADIHIDGASSALVGAMVRVFNTGGTGVYLNRGFVHVDTGAPRSWVSRARRR